jgi:hypothetical protein
VSPNCFKFALGLITLAIRSFVALRSHYSLDIFGIYRLLTTGSGSLRLPVDLRKTRDSLR